MAQQTINPGSGAGVGDGDGARAGIIKINDNFTEVYDGSFIDDATSKSTPVDADKLGLWDSVASTLKHLTWANLKATLDSVYTNITEGFEINVTNPNITGNANEPKAALISATFDMDGWDGTNMNPGFTNREGLNIVVTGNDGQNHNAGTPSTSAKTTWLPLNIESTYKACGQKFSQVNSIDAYGMGDAFLFSWRLDYANGPINGDEGTGYAAVSYCRQEDSLERATISTVPAQASIDTTLTQAVTADDDAQTVTVASTTGVSAGQWVVVGQETPDGTPNLEAVLVTSVDTGAGTITGTFLLPHNSGQAVKAAKVLTVSSHARMGQQRVLVNLTASAYTTGTATVSSGSTATGTGTNWTSTMVGGDAANVGAISFTADDYSSSPFNGTGEQSTLVSWYQIKTVSTTTSLTFHSFDIAGDTSYRGYQLGAAAAGYTIRPAMRILRMDGSTLICEWSAHTWTVGDSVECAICPYPDVGGFQFKILNYTAGSQNRQFLAANNCGRRTFQKGIRLVGDEMPSGADVDERAWDHGYYVSNAQIAFRPDGCAIGFDPTGLTDAAISLGTGQGNAIMWDLNTADYNEGAFIRGEAADEGLTFRMANDGSSSTTLGAFRCIADDQNGLGHHSVSWGGVLECTAWGKCGSFTVAQLPSAATAGAGAYLFCSNETGGAVLVFSDGTNWRRVTDRAVAS